MNNLRHDTTATFAQADARADARADVDTIVALRSTRFHNPTARITLRGARAAYVGPGLNLAPHRNAVATLALALRKPFDLALPGSAGTLGPYASRQWALIPPGTWHHLNAHGPMAFLYLDALSDDLQTLASEAIGVLTNQEVAELVSCTYADTMSLLCRILGCQPRTAPEPDARVALLVHEINKRPEVITTLAQAAAIAGLSPSRCQYLLRSALGMPFRRYRLWRRMALVMRGLADGTSLTEVAHASGFSSSAHLSTAFKAMFGLAPSTLNMPGVVFDLD